MKYIEIDNETHTEMVGVLSRTQAADLIKQLAQYVEQETITIRISVAKAWPLVGLDGDGPFPGMSIRVGATGWGPGHIPVEGRVYFEGEVKGDAEADRALAARKSALMEFASTMVMEARVDEVKAALEKVGLKKVVDAKSQEEVDRLFEALRSS